MESQEGMRQPAPEPSAQETVEVVAAVIERAAPRGVEILIGQRKPVGKHALKWEFPGGKVEPGEDPRDALARELLEELDIRATVGEQIDHYAFSYGPGSLTQLTFFRVTHFTGNLANLDFAQIVWEKPEHLLGYDFLEGDRAFVKRLAEHS
jgi:8-oxo-dGTP diphosphatase